MRRRVSDARGMFAPLAIAGAIAGCGVDTPSDPGTETATEGIYEGSATPAYPETVLIDVLKSNTWGKQCTGVALAPAVVLTTAHCFTGYSRFRIFVPATGQYIETTNKIPHRSFADTDEMTDANTGFDAGLLLLPEKITLNRFPHLSPSFTTSSTKVRAVGRVSGGALSTSTVYRSPERTLKPWDVNRRYYLFSEATQEKGDCGGPVIRTDIDPPRHSVVAILDAGDNTASIATRLDPIYDWIVLETQFYTHANRHLAPTCPSSGHSCELTPVIGGMPCVAGNTLAYCCDLRDQPIVDGQCAGKVGDPGQPGDGSGSGGLPTTGPPKVVMWDIAGHVRNQNMVGIPGVKVQVWGFDESGHWDHYDDITEGNGAFKVGGFIVKGGKYEVKIVNNELRQSFAPYLYPAYTSWLWHTRNQTNKKDTPLGSTAYLNQKAGSDDCAGPDTTRSGNKRCDFIYTTDGNPAHLNPPAPTGLRVTCDPTTPAKPKATIWWNAQPRATLGYYVRVDHRPNSFDITTCTGHSGSIGKIDPYDRCVDVTPHTSLTVGPIERGAPYFAWLHAANVEGAISVPSAITFKCP